MKKSINILSTIVLSILLTIFLSACASTEKPPRERSETYIADVNPFEVETFHLYASLLTRKPKIHDFTVTFYPRTNYVFVKGRVGVDVVRFGFSYAERQSLLKAHDKYIEAYEASAIPNVKPNKKNAYSKGFAPVEWGVTGTPHSVYTTYMTNAQYLEKDKPYFKITFDPAEEEGREQISSPRLNIFLSPSQWETIIEVLGQEHLEEMTDAILEEANAF